MSKELPLLDFAEGQLPQPKKENGLELVETEEEKFIANLVEEILAEIAEVKSVRDEYKFSKVWGKKYDEIDKQLAQQDEFGSTNKRLKRMREIKDKVVKQVFARLPDSYRLGSRPKIEEKSTPKSRLLESIRGAQLKQWREERRAGQTYKESDLE